jgi:acyl carrier protein
VSVETTGIEKVLISILRDFLESDHVLSGETNLVSDLNLASVQVMEFVVEVEDHFDIAIDLESLSNIHTLSELAEAVRQSR